MVLAGKYHGFLFGALRALGDNDLTQIKKRGQEYVDNCGNSVGAVGAGIDDVLYDVRDSGARSYWLAVERTKYSTTLWGLV